LNNIFYFKFVIKNCMQFSSWGAFATIFPFYEHML
jgi:hypothetical protein